MEQIIKANDTILDILGKAKPSASGYRLIKYCLSVQVEEGTLLFSLLTREMVLLSPEEYAGVCESEYLRRRWFVVPEELDEKKYVGLVRWICANSCKKAEHITQYTILTTTDCNARCFYCYQGGCSKITMTEETAMKTADFIKDHCGGKKVIITWFGGEPLFNYPVIDLICERLREAGINYESEMVSNGYLFNDEIVEKAAKSWKLRRAQITLDGTEQVYNRSKAFVYREGSAYQVVMGNIDRLLEAGIGVSIRMNADFYNIDDLTDLADELAERFAGKKGLHAYAHLIFDDQLSWDERYTLEQWEQLYEARNRLGDKLRASGLASMNYYGVRRELPGSHCMADSDASVMIAADGHIGLCEHFPVSEFAGHIDSPERNQAVIDSWREREGEIPECNDCFYYPECIRLKKCPSKMDCIAPERASIRLRTEVTMVNEFRHWQGSLPEIMEDTVTD